MNLKKKLVAEFANIAPFHALGTAPTLEIQRLVKKEQQRGRVQLYLAQHVKTIPLYREELQSDLKRDDIELVILDNGAFEGGALDAVDLAQLVNGLVLGHGEEWPVRKLAIIAPDFPGENPQLTVDGLHELQEELSSRRLRELVQIFYVPQGRRGRVDDICMQIKWLAESIEWHNSKGQKVDSGIVDGICFSILASPIAMDAKTSEEKMKSRLGLLGRLAEADLASLQEVLATKYVHWLGLFNAPGELWHVIEIADELEVSVSDLMNSFDSASPWKAGFLGQLYEMSPLKWLAVPKPDVDVITDPGVAWESKQQGVIGLLNCRYVRECAAAIRAEGAV